MHAVYFCNVVAVVKTNYFMLIQPHNDLVLTVTDCSILVWPLTDFSLSLLSFQSKFFERDDHTVEELPPRSCLNTSRANMNSCHS